MITWDELESTAPDILKELLETLKLHKENPKYHPESSAYEHIKIVTERLIKTGDMDLVMAGFFYDLGKLSTAAKSEDGNWNISHGHEYISAKLVLRYKNWVQEMGANPYVVHEIVKNHMRIKFNGISKKDKDRLERYTIFQKLSQFINADNMKRKWDLDEGLNLPPKSNPELKKGDYIRLMSGKNKSYIWKVIEIVSSFNLRDVQYYIIQTESDDIKLTAKLYPETDKWIKIVGLQEGLNLLKKPKEVIDTWLIAYPNRIKPIKVEYDLNGMILEIIRLTNNKSVQLNTINYIPARYNPDSNKILDYVSLKIKNTSPQDVSGFDFEQEMLNLERIIKKWPGIADVNQIVTYYDPDFDAATLNIEFTHDPWVYDITKSNRISEGLNNEKKEGDVQFDRVTVHFKDLSYEDLNQHEIDTIVENNIKKPTQLTYKIDGKDFPESMNDPKYPEMWSVLERTFKAQIEPYFETRGYYLWSY